MSTLPAVAANPNPTPSNDTFIMAKAEEALKALQMMGVIPSFYAQDSTEVRAVVILCIYISSFDLATKNVSSLSLTPVVECTLTLSLSFRTSLEQRI